MFELSISGFTFYHFANLFELSKRSVRRYSHPWWRAVDLKRTQHDVVNNSIRNLIRTSVSEERNLCSRESAIRLSRWKTIARKLWSIQVACVPIEMENGKMGGGGGRVKKIFCESSDGFGIWILSGGENLLNRDSIASVHVEKLRPFRKNFEEYLCVSIFDLFQSRNFTIFLRNSLETQNSFPTKIFSIYFQYVIRKLFSFQWTNFFKY